MINNCARIITILMILFIIASPFVLSSDFVLRENSAQAFNFRQGLDKISENVGLKTGSEETDLANIIGDIIYGVLGLVGVVAMLLIVIAGVKWMMAGGNEEAVANAKKMLQNAVIGVLVIILAYAITFFILEVLLPTQVATRNT